MDVIRVSIAAVAAVLIASSPCGGGGKDDWEEPASCANSSDWTSSLSVSGSWFGSEAGRRRSLEIVVFTWDDVELGRPDVSGGTVTSAGDAGLTLRMDDDATVVDVEVEARCGSDRRTLQMSVPIPEDPEGEAVIQWSWT